VKLHLGECEHKKVEHHWSRQSGHIWRLDCQSYAPSALTPRMIPGTHFRQGLSQPQGGSGRIRQIE
jgi:hypothetical protein